MKRKELRVGMDLWEVNLQFQQLVRLVRTQNWRIYEIHNGKHGLRFYAPLTQRKQIANTLEHAHHIKTTGMLGFLIRQMRRPSRVLCVLCAIAVWWILSHTIFAVVLSGDQEESKVLISQTLQDMGYEPPFFDHDMQQMKAEIKKRLENEIAWMEVYQVGSRYHIQFTTKEFADIETLGHDQLIAQKDGVIEHFELQHGNKLVAINDFVHAGDVLVNDVLSDSSQTDQELYVKGKVYAYTWKEVHVEMEAGKLPQAFAFYQLLFEARRQASEGLHDPERIAKENILQFHDNAGTISMDLHYTLIEDITTPK